MWFLCISTILSWLSVLPFWIWVFINLFVIWLLLWAFQLYFFIIFIPLLYSKIVFSVISASKLSFFFQALILKTYSAFWFLALITYHTKNYFIGIIVAFFPQISHLFFYCLKIWEQISRHPNSLWVKTNRGVKVTSWVF